MDQAFSPETQHFSIIKQQIIKTSQLLEKFKNKQDVLAKATKAFRNLKSLYEKGLMNIKRLENEKSLLTYRNHELTLKIEESNTKNIKLFEELENVKPEYEKLLQKYNQKMIEWQKLETSYNEGLKKCICRDNFDEKQFKYRGMKEYRELKLEYDKLKLNMVCHCQQKKVDFIHENEPQCLETSIEACEDDVSWSEDEEVPQILEATKIMPEIELVSRFAESPINEFEPMDEAVHPSIIITPPTPNEEINIIEPSLPLSSDAIKQIQINRRRKYWIPNNYCNFPRKKPLWKTSKLTNLINRLIKVKLKKNNKKKLAEFTSETESELERLFDKKGILGRNRRLIALAKTQNHESSDSDLLDSGLASPKTASLNEDTVNWYISSPEITKQEIFNLEAPKTVNIEPLEVIQKSVNLALEVGKIASPKSDSLIGIIKGLEVLKPPPLLSPITSPKIATEQPQINVNLKAIQETVKLNCENQKEAIVFHEAENLEMLDNAGEVLEAKIVVTEQPQINVNFEVIEETVNLNCDAQEEAIDESFENLEIASKISEVKIMAAEQPQINVNFEVIEETVNLNSDAREEAIDETFENLEIASKISEAKIMTSEQPQINANLEIIQETVNLNCEPQEEIIDEAIENLEIASKLPAEAKIMTAEQPQINANLEIIQKTVNLEAIDEAFENLEIASKLPEPVTTEQPQKNDNFEAAQEPVNLEIDINDTISSPNSPSDSLINIIKNLEALKYPPLLSPLPQSPPKTSINDEEETIIKKTRKRKVALLAPLPIKIAKESPKLKPFGLEASIKPYCNSHKTPKSDVLASILEGMGCHKSKPQIVPSVMTDLDRPMSPDVIEVPDKLPKLIPLQKYQKLTAQEVRVLMDELIMFSTSELVVNDVAVRLSGQSVKYVAWIILDKLCTDTGKALKPANPNCPPLSQLQQILLGFLCKLEKSNHPGIIDQFLDLAERRLHKKNNNNNVTRLFTAVCKMRSDLFRVRQLLVDCFHRKKNLVPLSMLFVVLRMYPQVLLQQTDEPLAKTLVQICFSTLNRHPQRCLKFMYLKDLLKTYYNYVEESPEVVFNNLFINYIKNPTKQQIECSLLLLLKHESSDWSFDKIENRFWPLYAVIPSGNVNLKATLILFVGKICARLAAQEATLKVRQWCENLLQVENDVLVKRSLIYVYSKLGSKIG